MIITIPLVATFTSLFIILTLFFHKKSKKDRLEQEEEDKEKRVEGLLDKYIDEEQKSVMKDKLSIISKIISETEKHINTAVSQKVKVAEQKSKTQEKEFEVIKKANVDFSTFSSGFRSAMPTTEEEKIQDMSDLKEAMEMLESLEIDTIDISNKKVDVGLGMFYDKMSRKFKDIINEHHLSDYKFVPSDRLKHHAFIGIKNIKNTDILPILGIMKETKLLNDVVEVNPTFHLIVFTEKILKLTNPEKVVMTFAYDEETLSIKKLIELTEWKESYTMKTLESLKSKGLLLLKDDEVLVDGYGHTDERKKWSETIKIHVQKEKEKEEIKFQRYLERRRTLRVSLEQVKETKPQEADMESEEEVAEVVEKELKFKSKPKIKSIPKTLPKVKTPPKEETEKSPTREGENAINVQDIKDKDALLGAMEVLGEESVADLQKPKEGESPAVDTSFDMSLDIDDDERDLNDLVPEKILDFHEKFSLINGGIAQYDKVKEYVNAELKDMTEDVPDDLFKGMITQLKELQMIQNVLKMGSYEFILFQDIKLNFMHRRFITLAVGKKPLKKEDFMEGLRWDEEKVLKTMKELQELGILKLENDEIIIPGIIQEE